jgi:hypothetical protein
MVNGNTLEVGKKIGKSSKRKRRIWNTGVAAGAALFVTVCLLFENKTHSPATVELMWIKAKGRDIRRTWTSSG